MIQSINHSYFKLLPAIDLHLWVQLTSCSTKMSKTLKLDVYDAEKEEVLKNEIKYSLPVHIGYWNDGMFLQEEREKLVQYKRDHHILLIQKMRKMIRNLLMPLQPARELQYVNYGQNYHIKASEVPDSLNACQIKRTTGLFLAGLLNEKDVDHFDHFTHGCLITASTIKEASVRNIFVFESCDINRDGTAVNYGDDVYIRISETWDGKPLYLQSEQANIETFGSYLHVRMTQSVDMYCRFKLLHWNPEYREHTTGVGVPPRARIIIKHTATGQNLAVDIRKWIPTFFGPECMVICHSFKDSHKMETAENMFCIVGYRELNKTLVVRAAKGENIPDDMWM